MAVFPSYRSSAVEFVFQVQFHKYCMVFSLLGSVLATVPTCDRQHDESRHLRRWPSNQVPWYPSITNSDRWPKEGLL